MTLRNRSEPPGAARVGAPMIAVAIRRANEKDLRRLEAAPRGGAATAVMPR